MNAVERATRWNQNNPERHRAHGRRSSQKRQRAHQAYIRQIKLERGCVDCSYNAHADALQFDHLPEHIKLYTVSGMATYSREKVDAEIAKCEVVCANCHAVRTAQRRSCAALRGIH